MKLEFHIGPPDAGRRVDRYVQAALGNVPMSLVQRLLRTKKVRVNGARAEAGLRLEADDEVIVHHTTAPPQAVSSEPVPYEGPPLSILQRGDAFLAINKPAGVSCSVDDDPTHSVDAWLRSELASEIEAGSVRPELCHRLDRGTTGAVLVALTAQAVTRFHQAIAASRLTKTYRVVVWGAPPDNRFAIDTPLSRRDHSRRDEPKVVPAPAKGTPARTELRVIAASRRATLLEAIPVTGRTHQIRAHLKSVELPVVGDPRYGDPARDRLHHSLVRSKHQLLHAFRLESADLALDVEAPLPSEMNETLLRLDLTPSL